MRGLLNRRIARGYWRESGECIYLAIGRESG
jgi:hypothetical protein